MPRHIGYTTTMSLLLAAGTCLAEPLMYTDQQREVEATAFAMDLAGSIMDSANDAAVDFSPFGSQVTADATQAFAATTADASQLSSLDAGGFAASGSANVTWSWEPAGDGSGTGAASSLFDVSFTLTDDTPYSIETIVAVLNTDPLVDVSASVMLTGPSGLVFNHMFTGAGGDTFVDAGVLQAGQYEFVASGDVDIAGAGQNGGAARGSFLVNAIVPEPATIVFLLLAVPARTRVRRARAGVS